MKNHNLKVPANETDRLLSVRSLMSSRVSTTPELDILTSLIKNQLQATSCAVTIIDEDWQHVSATAGLEIVGCPRASSVCNYVVQSGKPFIVEDMTKDAAFKDQPFVTGELHFRFYAGFPVEIDEGLTLGSLCIIDTKPRKFTPQQIKDLQNFAKLASALLSLHRKNIYLQNNTTTLKQAMLTDPLTKLYNRRALKEHVAPILRQLFNEKQSAGVILMDMDNFKSVNDTYGHPIGDKLLKHVAIRIRSLLRPVDIPVRIGGDEFCIILPSIENETQLNSVAERLIQAFRTPFIIADIKIHSSVSLGLLIAPDDGRTGEELSAHADKALYVAKAKGRNCAVRFDRSML